MDITVTIKVQDGYLCDESLKLWENRPEINFLPHAFTSRIIRSAILCQLASFCFLCGLLCVDFMPYFMTSFLSLISQSQDKDSVIIGYDSTDI